jgi:hypothetical protein
VCISRAAIVHELSTEAPILSPALSALDVSFTVLNVFEFLVQDY